MENKFIRAEEVAQELSVSKPYMEEIHLLHRHPMMLSRLHQYLEKN